MGSRVLGVLLRIRRGGILRLLAGFRRHHRLPHRGLNDVDQSLLPGLVERVEGVRPQAFAPANLLIPYELV